MTAAETAEIQAIARDLATKLFAASRESKNNLSTVPSFDLKTMARQAHTIAERLK